MEKKIISFLLLTISLSFCTISFAETILLKSGKTIEGKIIDKTDKYIKIDFYGVPLTYFLNEVESISGQKETFPIEKKPQGIKEEILIEAAKKGDIQKIQQLISEGLDVNVKDNYGTVLMYAAGNDHKEIVEFLLSKGADINVGNDTGVTPLVWAVTGCHKDIVELLLAKGAKVNTRDSSMSMTPLMWAAHRCNRDIVELLLAKGADIEMKDKNGKTAWIWSVAGIDKDVVGLFLSKGADVSAKDNSGGTVLMWAAGMGRKENVELLLSKGADVNVKNNNGATASMYAEKNGFKEIAAFLRSHEELAQPANIPTKSEFGAVQKVSGEPVARNSLDYDSDLLNVGIWFVPPNGWIKKILLAGEGIGYVHPQNKASVVISSPKSSNYLSFLAFLVIIRIKNRLISEEKITLSGVTCYVFIYEMLNNKGETAKIKNYNIFKNGKVYTVGYLAFPSEFNNYLSDFEVSLGTFKVE